MRKVKYIYGLLAALLLLICTPLTSCLGDDLAQTTDEGRGLIILSLNGVQTRAAGDALFTGDAEITKVRVFVFVGATLEANKLFTTGETTFNNPFVLDVATGTKDVYVVANESGAMATALASVKTKEGLLAILANNIEAPLLSPLPMTGSVAGVLVVEQPDAETRNVANVTLTRVAAKIALKIKKGDTSANIVLNKIRLYRATAKSKLFDGQSVTGQTYWNYTYNGSDAIPVTTEGVDAWTSATPLYLYENPGTKEDTLNRATYLVFDATYNGVNTTYHAYINDDNSDAADHKYSIKRNHFYNITATITNIGEFDGLTMSTNVLPWNLLPSSVLFERVYNINPFPTPGNRTYTAANPTDLVTFTFTLHNPLGAKWRAHLSNVFDFEFSTAEGAIDYGGLGTEYTISIKPKNAQSTEANTTEFYITVDGEEIPLISGSTLIGAGNRIIINQPAMP